MSSATGLYTQHNHSHGANKHNQQQPEMGMWERRGGDGTEKCLGVNGGSSRLREWTAVWKRENGFLVQKVSWRFTPSQPLRLYQGELLVQQPIIYGMFLWHTR